MSRLLSETIAPYGVVRDIPPQRADPAFWTFAQNLDFNENKTERQRGYINRPLAPLFSPERLHYRRFEGTDQFLYAGNDGIGVMTGTQNDITPTGYPTVLSLTPGEHNWTSLNGIPVWNHPGFTPHYHIGDTSVRMLQLPNWPATWACQVVRSFKFYLLAINVTEAGVEYENQIRWSSSADVGSVPAEWTPSATNDAGDMFFAATPGAVIDAVPLRDNLVVYKDNSTYLMQFIGQPFIFRQRIVFATQGLLAANCATEWRGRHFVAIEGDIMVHDGNSGQSVADKFVRRDIFDNISPNYADRSFVMHDPAALSMNFYFPSRSSDGWCDKRAIWNYRDNVWSVQDTTPDVVSHATIGNYAFAGLGEDWQTDLGTWDSDSTEWDDTTQTGVQDKTLVGLPVTTELAQPIRGFGRNGQAVASQMAWATKDLGALYADSPNRLAYVDRIWIDAISGGNATLFVKVGWQENESSPVRFGRERSFVIGKDKCLGIQEKGRYVTIQLRAETDVDWSFVSMTLDCRIQGRF